MPAMTSFCGSSRRRHGAAPASSTAAGPDNLGIEDVKLGYLRSANFLTYLPLMYYRSMLNGEGKLDELMNDRYPSIRPTTVREYVAREGL
jgi:hypothetical protein